MAITTLFLCGDIMTGRGIDQILPHPGDWRIYEEYIQDAREYVKLAELADGTIFKPVHFAYIWGDALEVLSNKMPAFTTGKPTQRAPNTLRQWP